MTRTKVYDVPTRIFHLLFAAGFLGAFAVAQLVDDESPVFALHTLAGLVLVLLVGLRLIWGAVGSRYARFSSFDLRPSHLAAYLARVVTGKAEDGLGHNPASSWAALTMMGLAVGLGVTGTLMSTGGNKEVLEDVHELLANAFVLVAALHVAGIFLHMIRHRDGLALSMLSGEKEAVAGQAGITNSHRGIALVLVAIVAAFVIHLGNNYDATAQTLDLFGSTLQLGEAEDGHGESAGGEDDDDRGEDDDD